MTSPMLSAEWNHDPGCSCSKTSMGCCLQTVGTLWPESYLDWPRSATWDATGFYEHPTSAPRTSAPGSSSSPGLLPTPRTSDTNGTGTRGNGGPDLRTVVSLLPTPRATDGTHGGPNQRGSSGDLTLPSLTVRLSSGDATKPPSADGNTSPDAPPPAPPNPPREAAGDSPRPSPNG